MTETIDHKFPIRPGEVVTIRNVPTDLTLQEAERLRAFVMSLVVKEEAKP